MLEQRALVWAEGRDGPLTCAFLGEAGFQARACTTWEELCAEIERGVGVLIIAGELLTDKVRADLEAFAAKQPPWSDIPMIIVAGRPLPGSEAMQVFMNLGNVSVLHRPLSLDTLSSTVGAALRARTRQYQVRDLLLQREDADRRREEFLAMLAHELRNPLAPIRTGIQVLRLVDSPDIIEQTQNMIERQIANLSRLIDDLLDVSRITRGKISLKWQHVSVEDVLKQAADGLARLAAEKGLRITLVPPAEPLLVNADPIRLEQMIGNVLANAIKFTPEHGEIRLTASCEQGEVVIRVRDTGIGIPPHMLTKVFELFAQTDRPLDRAQGGLGIGLTVVKSLAELHGGSVHALSEGEGKGTEVVIRLPALPQKELSEEERTAPVQNERAGLRRILVVEDNRDAAHTMATYLRAFGHKVDIVYDGLAGITAAQRERPDVVICDIGLPGMDGYQLARSLRADPRLKDCLLVAVTGYGEARDRERGFEAGFQHYLTKPADPKELARLVASL